MNLRVLAMSMLVLMIFSLGPILIGWHRVIWARLRPNIVGTLGRVGRPLEGRPERSPLIWAAFGGPVIALLAARDLWGADGAVLAETLAAYPAPLIVGAAIYLAGLAGFALGRRAGEVLRAVRTERVRGIAAFFISLALTLLGSLVISACTALTVVSAGSSS